MPRPPRLGDARSAAQVASYFPGGRSRARAIAPPPLAAAISQAFASISGCLDCPSSSTHHRRSWSSPAAASSLPSSERADFSRNPVIAETIARPSRHTHARRSLGSSGGPEGEAFWFDSLSSLDSLFFRAEIPCPEAELSQGVVPARSRRGPGVVPAPSRRGPGAVPVPFRPTGSAPPPY